MPGRRRAPAPARSGAAPPLPRLLPLLLPPPAPASPAPPPAPSWDVYDYSTEEVYSDCPQDDLPKSTWCGTDGPSGVQGSVADCEKACLAHAGCGGFIYPHGVLKARDCLSRRQYSSARYLYILTGPPTPAPPPTPEPPTPAPTPLPPTPAPTPSPTDENTIFFRWRNGTGGDPLLPPCAMKQQYASGYECSCPVYTSDPRGEPGCRSSLGCGGCCDYPGGYCQHAVGTPDVLVIGFPGKLSSVFSYQQFTRWMVRNMWPRRARFEWVSADWESCRASKGCRDYNASAPSYRTCMKGSARRALQRAREEYPSLSTVTLLGHSAGTTAMLELLADVHLPTDWTVDRVVFMAAGTFLNASHAYNDTAIKYIRTIRQKILFPDLFHTQNHRTIREIVRKRRSRLLVLRVHEYSLVTRLHHNSKSALHKFFHMYRS